MGRGTSGERGRVHEGRTRCSHVAFLSAAKTASFFETFLLFFWGKLSWFLLGVYVHSIWVFGGSVPDRHRGVVYDWGSRQMLLGN